MIIGAHTMIQSVDPQADQRFLRDVLGLPSADVGDGMLVFGFRAGEALVHPGGENDVHELYLMCDDVQAFCDDMKRKNVECAAVQDRGWGLVTTVALPGGGRLGVYEPRHPRPRL